MSSIFFEPLFIKVLRCNVRYPRILYTPSWVHDKHKTALVWIDMSPGHDPGNCFPGCFQGAIFHKDVILELVNIKHVHLKTSSKINTLRILYTRVFVKMLFLLPDE